MRHKPMFAISAQGSLDRAGVEGWQDLHCRSNGRSPGESEWALWIETAGNTVVDSVPGLTGQPVVISPDGGFAYVPGGGPGDGTSRIWIFQTASNTVVDSIFIGAPTLQDLAFTPDGMFAYGSEGALADVWIIETATHTVVDRLDIGGGPWAVAITPD